MKTTRTNIVLRDDLIEDIMRFGKAKTKREAGRRGITGLCANAQISAIQKAKRKNLLGRRPDENARKQNPNVNRFFSLD